MDGKHGRPAVAAEDVFRAEGGITVLQGPAGGGKSTLLRTYRAHSADRWLSTKAGTAVPVLVNASALTGRDPLPAALAKAATAELTQFGLLDDLTTDFFRRSPTSGAPWRVLVDGLDEIADAETRRAVLQMLTHTATTEPTLYKFVVATRPLAEQELDILGPHVQSFELLPFSASSLFAYATKWFRNLNDPRRHAELFMDGLKRSNLDVLAHTPLMASMLCQLYAADPAHPLPDGRTGAYQSFVELIYEQNSHKSIKSTHDAAIHRLRDRHQIPRDNQAAEQAAQQVRNHLPELIDHLAYERNKGSTAPAVEVLASHLHVNRPQKLKEHLWISFLGDLLRPTGLLTQGSDDFNFRHHTLLEYHAARHATRNTQARAQLLHDLIASSNRPGNGGWKPPALGSSYLGFLLDGLLAQHDDITAQTIQYLEEITLHGGEGASFFLAGQVHLRTALPPTILLLY